MNIATQAGQATNETTVRQTAENRAESALVKKRGLHAGRMPVMDVGCVSEERKTGRGFSSSADAAAKQKAFDDHRFKKARTIFSSGLSDIA